LENASSESARLLREIAEQIQILAAAQEQATRTCRIAILLAAAAMFVGVGAGILAMVR
jgi:CHASE3 domain sensor protein